LVSAAVVVVVRRDSRGDFDTQLVRRFQRGRSGLGSLDLRREDSLAGGEEEGGAGPGRGQRAHAL